LEIKTENSGNAKSQLNEQIDDYILSLHNISDKSKEQYSALLKIFVRDLIKKGITSFNDVKRTDIGQFLSSKRKPNTRNLYIFLIKSFYTIYLGNDKIVEHLHQKPEEETITPSDLLTPDEVVCLANEAGKKREMYKVVILTLFESCARINELLQLRIGDAIFGSVVDKEGNRKLIATLHFKRAKGNVKKQPVVLTIFAGELKRWVEVGHPFKSNMQACLFPSPVDSNVPIGDFAVSDVLAVAGETLGISKRVNHHWFRHSGLSYFANDLNYNEQLLMWRAGWNSTQMASRYVHSGAELEAKAYLEKMGYTVPEKTQQKIIPKTCPHCQAPNPYTNSHCDSCAMPLALEDIMDDIVAFFQNCYHLKDWIEHDTVSKARLDSLGIDIDRALINADDDMKLLADLCNGSKHMELKIKAGILGRSGENPKFKEGQNFKVKTGEDLQKLLIATLSS
jgi:site-specific recombinase XerD